MAEANVIVFKSTSSPFWVAIDTGNNLGTCQATKLDEPRTNPRQSLSVFTHARGSFFRWLPEP